MVGRFIFVGDPRNDSEGNPQHNPPECQMFGRVFPLGVPIEVDGAHAVAKLLTNSHFKRVDDPPEQASPASSEPPHVARAGPPGAQAAVREKKKRKKDQP